MKTHSRHPGWIVASVMGLLATAGALRAQDPSPDTVDFNRDIRPLLSDRCYKCHGFDAQQRQGGLRLDTWEGLTHAIEGRHPVLPGNPARSEVVRRTTATDPAVRMPPADSGLSLSEDEAALIRRWVEDGAPFAPHWAFVTPTRPSTPAVAHRTWAKTPVDRFVLGRLEKHGLQPSAEADRLTLIRRVTLDLTGLPPTPEDIETFENDTAPDAYERLVDRLLASPRFGERMAIMWLDVARYADTNGFHHDNIRTAWPYRDWVIRAFNDNLPYDRFVTQQLAGDLLPEADESQIIASAFSRMHNINDEGGALDDEYRVEAIADRIETTSTAFMGLTFTCARCHDHKYDPFTQEDYYSLFAFFNSVDERGVYGANFEQARAYPARYMYRPPDLKERFEKADGELALGEAALEAAAASVDAELTAWETEVRNAHGVAWVDATLTDAVSEEKGTLVREPDGSVRATGEIPEFDTHTLVFRTEATGLRLVSFEALNDAGHPGGSIGLAENGNAVVSSIEVEAESVRDPKIKATVPFEWAWADHEQRNDDYDIRNVLDSKKSGWALDGHNRKDSRTALLVSAAPFGYEGGTVLRVQVRYRSGFGHHTVGRARVRFAQAKDGLLSRFPVDLGDWWSSGPHSGATFDALYDEAFGPETARTIARRSKRFGWKHRPELTDGRPHALTGERHAFYFGRTVSTPVPRPLQIFVGSDDGIRVYLNGEEVLGRKVQRGVAPDQDSVTIDLPAGESALVVKVINELGPAGFFFRAVAPDDIHTLDPVAFLPRSARDSNLDANFRAALATRRSPTYAERHRRVTELRAAVAALEGEQVPVLVMRERDEPTPTHVLTRGHYMTPDMERPVTRRPPMALGGTLPEGAPANRLGFAQWLTDPAHPLTARVQVNRLWQMLFGTGIVKSSENFGQQADWPSHPGLLDWLAVEFMDSGWDQKALLRLIVTSSTYRQGSTAHGEARAADPENRLLAWFPRLRLPGELVRDQALHVAGLLRGPIGGPSVRPYQPGDLWQEVSIGGSSNTRTFVRDDGDALYRRSLYTFWKRTSPNPQMQAFDAPTREFCMVRRDTTNTPLQALVLWNDVQFVEAARVLAQRTLAERETTRDRLALMGLRCTGRVPTEENLRILEEALDGFLERYRNDPEDAQRLLSVGETPLPPSIDPVVGAAWTMMANVFLSLDATLVRS